MRVNAFIAKVKEKIKNKSILCSRKFSDGFKLHPQKNKLRTEMAGSVFLLVRLDPRLAFFHRPSILFSR